VFLELCTEGVTCHEFVDERRREPDHGSPTIDTLRHGKVIIRAINLRERRSSGRTGLDGPGPGPRRGLYGNDRLEGSNAGHCTFYTRQFFMFNAPLVFVHV
jgi:hypothetical protein